MIARIWHGTVPTARAEEYCALLQKREIPEIQAQPGSLGVQVMQRSEGPLTQFLIISYWDSLESVRQFTGDEVDLAKYYPYDHDYLIEFETHVIHYELILNNAPG